MSQNSRPSGLSQFLAELKRRHVVRAAVAYAAVAFVALQLGEIVLPAFLPGPRADSALQVMVVAFVLGFPVVMAMAWVYEITPKGVRSMAQLDAETGHRHHMGRLLPRVALAAVTVLAAGVAGTWWYRAEQAALAERESNRPFRSSPPAFVAATTTDASDPIRSLAVLPLDNLSPDQDYFTAGMHEALISELSQTTPVRVISRTSTIQIDQTGKSLAQIGAELGVDAVVEGSVFRADTMVRITVQLIHAASETHLLARNYERPYRDLIALQSEVAEAIADEVRASLEAREDAQPAEADRIAQADRAAPDPGVGEASPAGAGAGGARPAVDRGADQGEEPPTVGTAGRAAERGDAPDPGLTGSSSSSIVRAVPRTATTPEVQDAFLRGRYALSEGGPSGGTDAAMEHFADALELDPDFTPALVGLAGAHVVRGLEGDEASLSELIEARRLAARALEQDPTSTEAAEVLAGAEQALAEAVQRLETRVDSRVRSFDFSTLSGDSVLFVMAGDSIRIPQNPVGPMFTEIGGMLQVVMAGHEAREGAEAGAAEGYLRAVRRLEAAGRWDAALERAEQAVEMFPGSVGLRDELERLLALSGDVRGAAAVREEREERFGPGPGPDADDLVDAVQEDGVRGYWSWRLDDLRARRRAGEPVSWVAEAEALAAMGRNDSAVSALQQARQFRDPRLGTLRSGAVWDGLRADRRFQELLRALGRSGPPRPGGQDEWGGP